MSHEQIADMRHKETEAYIGCIMGVVIILAGLAIRFPAEGSGFLNTILMGGGFMLMIISGISSQYYSGKVKSLMKKYSNVPNTVVPPPPTSNICPTCHHPLSFIEEHKAWYCFNCKEYR